MLKREMKINFKNFLIWLSIMLGLLLIVFLIYPSIANSENIKLMDEMIKIFPEEVIKMFNMDIASMDTVFGWLKSEGFVFILLIIGCYSAILGSTILSKEETDKTIEYLNNLPVKRSAIVINKVLTGIFYVIMMVICIGIFNYIGLELSGSFDRKQFILLSITPIFSSIPLFFMCMLISALVKSKKVLGLGLGITLVSYVLQTLSGLSESVEFLKYTSVFTLSDIRKVIIDSSINPVMVIVSIILSIIFLILSIYRYNKKEFI